MSKGLAVQAHDLGWDGGQDYRSSGVTYSNLPVSRSPRVSVETSYPDWKDLTSAPTPYSNSASEYSNRVPAYSNLPGAESSESETDRWFPDWNELTAAPSDSSQRSDTAPENNENANKKSGAAGLLADLNKGVTTAWDHLAGVVSDRGCDAACVKDLYRRAFRAHTVQEARDAALRAPKHDTPGQRDKKLFGQVPSEVRVSVRARPPLRLCLLSHLHLYLHL